MEGRERKENQKQEKVVKAEKQKEDSKWVDNDKNALKKEQKEVCRRSKSARRAGEGARKTEAKGRKEGAYRS